MDAGGGTRTRSLPRQGLGFKDRCVYQFRHACIINPPSPWFGPEEAGGGSAFGQQKFGGPRIRSYVIRVRPTSQANRFLLPPT